MFVSVPDDTGPRGTSDLSGNILFRGWFTLVKLHNASLETTIGGRLESCLRGWQRHGCRGDSEETRCRWRWCLKNNEFVEDSGFYLSLRCQNQKYLTQRSIYTKLQQKWTLSNIGVDNSRRLTGLSSVKAHLAFVGSFLSISRTIRTKDSFNALLVTSTLVGCQAYSIAKNALKGRTKCASDYFKFTGDVPSQMGSNI